MKAKAFKLFLAALLLLLIGSGAAFADGSKRHYQPGHGGYYHQKGADHYRGGGQYYHRPHPYQHPKLLSLQSLGATGPELLLLQPLWSRLRQLQLPGTGAAVLTFRAPIMSLGSDSALARSADSAIIGSCVAQRSILTQVCCLSSDTRLGGDWWSCECRQAESGRHLRPPRPPGCASSGGLGRGPAR